MLMISNGLIIMKKLKINGKKLKTAINNLSLTIKSAAVDRGQIGEKTLHRLLRGEAINEAVVLRFFQNLGLHVNDFVIDSGQIESSRKENEKIIINENSNYKIVLKKFELPNSYYLPIEIDWIFDFTNPNIKVIDTLKSLNTSLTEYCGIDKGKSNSRNFENSLLRLVSTNIIKEYIQELEDNEIYTYSGIYTGWEDYDEEHRHLDRFYKIKYVNSKFKLALYFTRNNTANKLVADINIGFIPPMEIVKGYDNIIVDGDVDYYDDNGRARRPVWESI